MTSWVKPKKTSKQSHKEENTGEKKETTDEKRNGVVGRTDALLFTQANTGRMATAKTHRCKGRSIRCDPEKLPRNPRSNQNQIKRTLILPKLLGHAIESTKRLSQKEILKKDSPTLRISTGQSERDESSRTNEEHMIHPAAILKGWFMESNGVWGAAEDESQDPITWQTQNHEKPRDWDQIGQGEKGVEMGICSRTKLAQLKALITPRTELHESSQPATLHPSH